MMRIRSGWTAALAALCVALPITGFGGDDKTDKVDKVRFAVLGDFGTDDDSEKEVAKMVKDWNPDFIITVGDNSYVDPAKKKTGFERGVVGYFDEFIKTPADDPTGTKTRFFPAIGNHDYESDGLGGVDQERIVDYAKAFAVPPGGGGYHYYEFARGPVHFFALDSNKNAVWSGTKTDSPQYAWWRKALGGAHERWKIVYFHHAPYDSGTRHRRDTQMRAWKFEDSGVTAVLAGHEHVYERLVIKGVPFITNGIGGRHLHGFKRPFQTGSVVRYPVGDETTPPDKLFGAMLVEATGDTITFEEWNVDHKLVDRWPENAKPIEISPLQKILPSPSPAPSPAP